MFVYLRGLMIERVGLHTNKLIRLLGGLHVKREEFFASLNLRFLYN